MKSRTSNLRPMKIAALVAACISSGAFAAPGTPSLTAHEIIGWGKSYGFVQLTDPDGGKPYKDAVKLNDAVEVPLPFDIWSGNLSAVKARAVVDGVVDPESTVSMTPGQTKGRPVAHPKTPGKKKMQVELCDADNACTRSAELLVTVFDSTPEFADDLPNNANPANIPHTNNTGSVVATYFPTWGIYDRKFSVDKVPVENLTHILYGFIPMCGGNGINDSLKPINGGSSFQMLQKACTGLPDFTAVIHDGWGEYAVTLPGQTTASPLKGVLGQMLAAKKRNPALKILPSVGGWTLSDPFYFMGDDAKRKVFVDSMEKFLLTWKFFDGIDIDWEFPGGKGENPNLGDPVNDGATYIKLMQELRAMMDRVSQKTGKTYELTSAIGAGQDKIAIVDYKEASKYMDYIFDMTYDYSGAWTMKGLGHHAALNGPSWDPEREYSTVNSINAVLAQGVDPKKLVVGAAMYGRGWTGVRNMTDPANPFTGTASGPLPANPSQYAWEPGVTDLRGIQQFMLGANNQGINGFVPGYDEHAQAPYVFNPGTGTLVTYENGRSTEAKGVYTRQQQLGGMFSWDITGATGEILNAMHDGLGHPPNDGNVTPKPPVAVAGPNQTVTGPASITLDGSQSSNPQDDPLTYAWKQTSGPALAMTGADQAKASIDVPEVDKETVHGFTLTVKNAANLSSSANLTVTAKPKAEEVLPPVASLTGPATAEANEQVALSAAASSDPAGKPLTFKWTVPAGIHATPNGAALNFTAPTLTADQAFAFSVEVSNGVKSSTASHTVTVQKKDDSVAPTFPPYAPGVVYKTGDVVQNAGGLYECVIPGWCSGSPAHYAPGVGSDWTQAWKKFEGEGEVTPTPPPQPGDYPQYVAGTAYKFGDMVSNNGKVYSCKQPGWCSQAAYAPGGWASTSAWIEQ